MRGIGGPVIFKIFGVLLLFVAISILVYTVVPFVQYGMFDSCWGQFASQSNQLVPKDWEFQETKQVEIKYGSCVASLHFVNNDALETVMENIGRLEQEIKEEYGRDVDLRSYIDCDTSKPSHMIGVPRFQAETDVGGLVTWIVIGAGAGGAYGGKIGAIAGSVGAGVARDKVKTLLDDIEKMGKKPFCKDFDKEFISSTRIPDFGDDIKEEYCIVFNKGGKYYRVQGFEGKCGESSEDISAAIERMEDTSGIETRMALRTKAKEYYDNDDCVNAIPKYEELVKDYGDYKQKDMDISYLANCYFYVDLYAKAIEMSSQLVSSYPSSEYVPDALIVMASSYGGQLEWQKALEKYMEIVDKHSESPFVVSSRLEIHFICTQAMPEDAKCASIDQEKYYPEAA